MKDWMDDNADFQTCQVTVKLDAPQSTRTGNVLNKILYAGMHGHEDLYEMAPNPVGCPHHGGEHTLTIKGTRQDVCAWLDLVICEFPDWETAGLAIKNVIRREFIQGDWRKYGRISVQLRQIQVMERDEPDQPMRAKNWFLGEWENAPRTEWKKDRKTQERIDNASPVQARKVPWR